MSPPFSITIALGAALALGALTPSSAHAFSADRPAVLLKSIEADTESMNVAGRMEIELNLARFYETLHQVRDADRIYKQLALTVRESSIAEVVDADYVPQLTDLLEDAADTTGGTNGKAKDTTRPERPNSKLALDDPERILSHQELRTLAGDLRKEVIQREFDNPDGGKPEKDDHQSPNSTGLSNLAETFEDKPEYGTSLKAAIRTLSPARAELQNVSRVSALADLLIRNHEGKRAEDSYLDLAALYADQEKNNEQLDALQKKPTPSSDDLDAIEKIKESIGENDIQIKARKEDNPDWVDPRFTFDLRTRVDFVCTSAAIAAREPVDSPAALDLIHSLLNHFVFVDTQVYCPVDFQLAARESALPNPPTEAAAREALRARCPLPEKFKDLLGSDWLTSGSPEVTDYLFPNGDAPINLTPLPPKDDACATDLADTLDTERDTVINHEISSCTEPLSKSLCFERYRRRSAYLFDRNAFELLTSIATPESRAQ